jgi:hypothetical protein
VRVIDSATRSPSPIATSRSRSTKTSCGARSAAERTPPDELRGDSRSAGTSSARRRSAGAS